MRSFVSAFSALFLFAGLASAQIDKPSLSPRGRLAQELSLVRATIDYGRPSKRGRDIFGSLEPFGRVWRTGANQCTTLALTGDVKIGTQAVPAGTYSLFTIPGKKSWTFILNRNPKLWGAGGYDPALDLLRFDVKPERTKDTTETLTIDFSGFHANGADLTIRWDRTQIRVPVFVDVDEQVLTQIDERVRKAKGKVKAQSYFDAAMFLYQKDRDLKDAAAWMKRAVAGNPNAFWFAYYQAELAHHMKDKKTARASAERALAMAKKSAADYGYIAKCELLLKKL